MRTVECFGHRKVGRNAVDTGPKREGSLSKVRRGGVFEPFIVQSGHTNSKMVWCSVKLGGKANNQGSPAWSGREALNEVEWERGNIVKSASEKPAPSYPVTLERLGEPLEQAVYADSRVTASSIDETG